LTAPVWDVAAELHSAGDEYAESVVFPFVAQIADHTEENTAIKVRLHQILTQGEVST
jgi:hypothetical protein